MCFLTLHVNYDLSVAAHSRISFGPGWARVSMMGQSVHVIQPYEKIIQELSALFEMLAAGGITPHIDVVAIDGLDAPTASLSTRTGHLVNYSTIHAFWLSAATEAIRLRGAAAPTQPMPSQPMPPQPMPSQPMPPQPSQIVADAIAKSPLAMSAQTKKLLVGLQAHVKKYGAAPNFGSDDPVDIVKSYNYIKSAARDMNMDEATAECLRVGLAKK